VDEDDRRSYPRVGFKIPAHILVGPDQVKHKGYVMNMSEGGALVMMDANVLLNPDVSLSFQIPPEVICEASGRIVHGMEMGMYQGLGIELTDCNQSYVFFLRNLAKASPGDVMFYMRDIGRIIVRIP
jgi:hypothetical protein